MIRKWDIMDFQQQNFHTPGMSMATASLLLGLAAIFTTMTVFLPIVCGCLAILFALLSKGYGKKMITQAKVGLAFGTGSLVLTVILFFASLNLLISNPDILVEFGKQYDATCESLYGQSSEEILGFSYEEVLTDFAESLR